MRPFLGDTSLDAASNRNRIIDFNTEGPTTKVFLDDKNKLGRDLGQNQLINKSIMPHPFESFSDVYEYNSSIMTVGKTLMNEFRTFQI